MNYKIDIFPIAAVPVQHLIWNEDKTELAGYCLITGKIERKGILIVKETRIASLWHIYVDPKYRRQGYARALIDSLRVNYDVIKTQALTPESKKLLMNTYFKKEKNENYDGIDNFIWEKKPS